MHYVSNLTGIKRRLENKMRIELKKNRKVFVGVKIVYTFAVLLKRRTALLKGSLKSQEGALKEQSAKG